MFCWRLLIEAVDNMNHHLSQKLLTRINQSVKAYQKGNSNFDLETVNKNHQEVFNSYKMIYDQLIIEHDLTDILHDVSSLSSKEQIQFNLVGIGKWIKIYGGNSSKIFFLMMKKQ